jgi:hypothetical protein
MSALDTWHDAGARSVPTRYVRVVLLAAVTWTCPGSAGAGAGEGSAATAAAACHGAAVHGSLQRCFIAAAPTATAAHTATTRRRAPLALASLAAVANDGSGRHARRYPEDRTWFVSPLRAESGHGSEQTSYFEETWGPVLEEARQKRSRAADAASPATKPDQAAAADTRARAQVKTGENKAGDHVQAMLEAYNDDDSECLDAPEVHGLVGHGPVPRPPARWASNVTPGRWPAPPAGQDRRVVMEEEGAPRCGPRGSVRGRAL